MIENKLVKKEDIGEKFEKIFQMTIEQMMEYFNNLSVTVTEESVQKFLLEQAAKAGIDMTPVGKQGLINLSDDVNIEVSARNFEKELTQSQFKYNDYDIEYFKKNIEILKSKGIAFCQLLMEIESNRVNHIQLIDLDIANYPLYIRKYDLMRLFQVIGSIYQESKDFICKANNYETYLKTTVNLSRLYADGLFEHDLYFLEKLQMGNFISQDKTSLSLSPNQVRKIDKNMSWYF